MKRILIGLMLVAIGALASQLAGPWLGKMRAAGKSGAEPGAVAGAPKTSAPAAPATMEFAAADLIKIRAQTIERSIPLTGTLKPANQVVVKSKSSGEIRDILVREGALVKKGQVLAHIDPVELQWRVKEREAQVHSAQASWEQAKRTYDNNKALVDKNFISQTALDNSRAQLDAAQSGRDAANANLTLAKRALSDTVVLAVIDGTVGERFAQPGEKVSPDNRILSIVDLSRMEVEANVPAGDVAAVAVGQKLDLTIEGIAERQSGTVTRISPATSAGSRSVPVFIAIESQDKRLRAGLFAQANLTVQKKPNVLVVPISAVRDNGGRTFVYVIDGNLLQERVITTGLRDDNARTENGSIGAVEVLGGVSAGDTIVAANLGLLRTGSPVKISGK